MDIGWQLRRRRRHAVPGVPEIGNLNGFWNHFQCLSDHLYPKIPNCAIVVKIAQVMMSELGNLQK